MSTLLPFDGFLFRPEKSGKRRLGPVERNGEVRPYNAAVSMIRWSGEAGHDMTKSADGRLLISGTVTTNAAKQDLRIRTRGTHSTAWVALATTDEIVSPSHPGQRCQCYGQEPQTQRDHALKMLLPGTVIARPCESRRSVSSDRFRMRGPESQNIL
jgi:hypothetical protein